MPFLPKSRGKEMKWERVERHTIHRQPPLGGSHDFHAGYGAAAGRSSDLQALPVKLTGVSTGPSSRF
jgi:hypothetical protein